MTKYAVQDIPNEHFSFFSVRLQMESIKRDSDSGGTVYTAMTPADHRSFARFRFTCNIAYERMQQREDWVKVKAE